MEMMENLSDLSKQDLDEIRKIVKQELKKALDSELRPVISLLDSVFKTANSARKLISRTQASVERVISKL